MYNRHRLLAEIGGYLSSGVLAPERKQLLQHLQAVGNGAAGQQGGRRLAAHKGRLQTTMRLWSSHSSTLQGQGARTKRWLSATRVVVATCKSTYSKAKKKKEIAGGKKERKNPETDREVTIFWQTIWQRWERRGLPLRWTWRCPWCVTGERSWGAGWSAWPQTSCCESPHCPGPGERDKIWQWYTSDMTTL